MRIRYLTFVLAFVLSSCFTFNNALANRPEVVVKSFILWYKEIHGELNKIRFIKPGRICFYVDTANVRFYLAQLKASGYLSEGYLKSLEAEVDRCSQEIGTIRVNGMERPPTACFSYDLVLRSQEHEDFLSELDSSVFSVIEKSGDKVIVLLELTHWKQYYTLKREGLEFVIEQVGVIEYRF